MEFIKWLLSKELWANPIWEYISAFIILVAGSLFVAFVLSPFWLAVTIPIGVIAILHSVWRALIRGG